MSEEIAGFQGERRWLSNFALARLLMKGRPYPTVENAYQASKTLDLAARIPFETFTPGQAKRAGRALVLRPHWDDVKQPIMRMLLVAKFCQEPYKSLLLATGSKKIIELNTWGDTYWGVCRGVGYNHLGLLIMSVRDELREEGAR